MRHNSKGIIWTRYDHGFKDKPMMEWCADGDGMLVVKETRDGNKLVNQGNFVQTLDSRISIALDQATDYMAEQEPVMFENLCTDIERSTLQGNVSLQNEMQQGG